MIADIIFLALIILGAAHGAKRGLIKSVWGIGAWIVTIILVKMMAEPVTELISNTSLYLSVKDAMFEKISQQGTENLAFIPQSLITSTTEDTVSVLAEIIARASSYIILIVVIRVLLGVVFGIVNAISKLPVISSVNKITGAIIGVVNVFIISTVVLAIIAVVGVEAVANAIQDSSIVKYLYNNNILLNLFI